MKKVDKAKLAKAIAMTDAIIALICFVWGIITQIHTHDTTQALCWVILGVLVGATTIEVK